MTSPSLADLASAIDAELTAEATAASAEAARRAAWWATTWTLAEVPRSEWGPAKALYAERTGHSPERADTRRMTGQRLPRTHLKMGLQPALAIIGATALGAGPDPADAEAMVELIAGAERDGLSNREFRLQLTGKSWTNAPEHLTDTERLAIVRQVAREAPEKLAEVVEDDYRASSAVTDLRDARGHAHRVDQERETAGVRGVQRQARELYDRGDTGTADTMAAAVHRMARELVSMRVTRDIMGRAAFPDDAALAAALAAVHQASGSWHAALIDGATAWTAEDQRLAAELGVDLDR